MKKKPSIRFIYICMIARVISKRSEAFSVVSEWYWNRSKEGKIRYRRAYLIGSLYFSGSYIVAEVVCWGRIGFQDGGGRWGR